jgi:hypothetical protein
MRAVDVFHMIHLRGVAIAAPVFVALLTVHVFLLCRGNACSACLTAASNLCGAQLEHARARVRAVFAPTTTAYLTM